jgi:urate oxidase
MHMPDLCFLVCACGFACWQVESVFLNMPNLHFIPCAPVGSTFDNDVYVATSEPHGNIEAVVTRKEAKPHCRF